MKLTIAVVSAVLILPGCGGEDATQEGGGQTASPTASAPTSGCSAAETDELYVTKLYNCPSRATQVYLFNTTSARDSWRKVAEEFGAVVVGQGDTWLEVKE